ncbi:MAG: hypothetical protein AMJ45_03340 [Syntrophobacter sp. DG_60]|nr:MAG: hypothetical protein AMJ45_03340 [Syntrophobacter sp. DG_60]
MRIPILALFRKSPFEDLKIHANKVRECTWMFKKAIECYIDKACEEYESLAKEVSRLEHEADAIKRDIRGHLPKGIMMPVDKFELFAYLKEQDKVLDAVQDTLDWLTFRLTDTPKEVEEDLLALVDKSIEAIELLGPMLDAATAYFRYYNKKDRETVKELIREIRQKEHDADQIEKKAKKTMFNLNIEHISICHFNHVLDKIGEIADHVENAGDMMRAMIAK